VRSDALQAAAAARVVDRLFDFTANFADAMIAAEIKSHFASLPNGSERIAAINAAVRAKDTTTLRAIGACLPAQMQE
jgi:hypothetical protein